MKLSKEIWNALEAKYKTEKIGLNKFIIQMYFDYKMLDNISNLDEVHELQILVNKLRNLSINILESFKVGAILRISHQVGIILGRSFFICRKISL